MKDDLLSPSDLNHLDFDIDDTDRVRVGDTYYLHYRHVEAGYCFRAADRPFLKKAFSRGEIHDLLLSGEAEIDRYYYWSAHPWRSTPFIP